MDEQAGRAHVRKVDVLDSCNRISVCASTVGCSQRRDATAYSANEKACAKITSAPAAPAALTARGSTCVEYGVKQCRLKRTGDEKRGRSKVVSRAANLASWGTSKSPKQVPLTVGISATRAGVPKGIGPSDRVFCEIHGLP